MLGGYCYKVVFIIGCYSKKQLPSFSSKNLPCSRNYKFWSKWTIDTHYEHHDVLADFFTACQCSSTTALLTLSSAKPLISGECGFGTKINCPQTHFIGTHGHVLWHVISKFSYIGKVFVYGHFIPKSRLRYTIGPVGLELEHTWWYKPRVYISLM